jgi:hypothetical protein
VLNLIKDHISKLSKTKGNDDKESEKDKLSIERELFGELVADSKRDPVEIMALFNVLQITPRDLYYLWKKHIGEREGLINSRR